MNSKLASVLLAYCLFYYLSGAEGSFIKPNNVPRVGRSNEEMNPFDQGSMGYVIKSNKNIPRMGRRNFDSVSELFTYSNIFYEKRLFKGHCRFRV